MLSPNRRQFLASSIRIATVLPVLQSLSGTVVPDLVIIKNAEPEKLVRHAVELLGGMSRFVKPGQTVLIKPNMSWDRFPEQAANTNPLVVAALVRLCKEAGARYIRILDRTCNHPQRCYKRSGIESAAVSAGAHVRHIVPSLFVETPIPNGKLLASWPIYRDVFNADVIINMPIAKHHNVSGVTLGMKNVMGLLGGDRGLLHTDFATKIVDLNTVIRPTLTIVDAYRILKRNGPSGGNLDDVHTIRTLIAGTDPVATDARAAQLFDLAPTDLDYLIQAQDRGLGHIQLEHSRIREYTFPG